MAFYSQAQAMSSDQIKALCKRHVTASHESQWGWAENGAFKPLNVWAKIGHDAEAIKAKAKPEDIRVHPDYGWDEYRVRELQTQRGESSKVTDVLQVLTKTRTRAPKRKSSQESARSKQQSDPSFSSMSSNSSSSEEEPNANGEAPKKGKGKAKAKAGADAKKRQAAKAKAKAAITKLQAAKDGLRKAIAHPSIFEVDDSVTAPVKSHLGKMSRVEQLAKEALKKGDDAWEEEFSEIDLKAAQKAGQTLQKALREVNKPAKKAKKGEAA